MAKFSDLMHMLAEEMQDGKLPEYAESELESWLEWIYDKKCEEEAMIASIKERKEALAARQASCENRIERLKSMAMALLAQSGKQKVKLPEFTAYISSSKPSVVVDDADKLADEYVTIKRVPNKTAIKAHLDAGVIIDGAYYGEAKETVIMRSK